MKITQGIYTIGEMIYILWEACPNEKDDNSFIVIVWEECPSPEWRQRHKGWWEEYSSPEWQWKYEGRRDCELVREWFTPRLIPYTVRRMSPLELMVRQGTTIETLYRRFNIAKKQSDYTDK